MEIIEDGGTTTNPTPDNRPQQPDTNTPLHTLGRIVVVCGKILLGCFFVGWIVAALAILIGFITLMAMGTFESSVIAFEGMSPIVFAGLVCAVVVLFMGIVGDVILSLLRSKPVNLRKLAIGAVVWLIFFVWLCIGAVRNADKWALWGYQVEERLEQWEESLEAWEDRFEESLEFDDAFWNNFDAWDNSTTFTLDGVGDLARWAMLEERIEQLEGVEDEVERVLLKDGKVIINVEHRLNDGECLRTTTVELPHRTITTTTTLPHRGTCGATPNGSNSHSQQLTN